MLDLKEKFFLTSTVILDPENIKDFHKEARVLLLDLKVVEEHNEPFDETI